VFKRGGAIAGLAVFAMTFVSGSLFPLSVLPGWLEAIGRVMPTRFAFDGMRAALHEGGGWGTDALVLLAFAAVLVPLSVWAFGASLRHARRAGTLAQY
jgi:ABC-2 type transport system permease protein